MLGIYYYNDATQWLIFGLFIANLYTGYKVLKAENHTKWNFFELFIFTFSTVFIAISITKLLVDSSWHSNACYGDVNLLRNRDFTYIEKGIEYIILWTPIVLAYLITWKTFITPRLVKRPLLNSIVFKLIGLYIIMALLIFVELSSNERSPAILNIYFDTISWVGSIFGMSVCEGFELLPLLPLYIVFGVIAKINGY